MCYEVVFLFFGSGFFERGDGSCVYEKVRVSCVVVNVFDFRNEYRLGGVFI